MWQRWGVEKDEGGLVKCSEDGGVEKNEGGLHTVTMYQIYFKK